MRVEREQDGVQDAGGDVPWTVVLAPLHRRASHRNGDVSRRMALVAEVLRDAHGRLPPNRIVAAQDGRRRTVELMRLEHEVTVVPTVVATLFAEQAGADENLAGGGGHRD